MLVTSYDGRPIKIEGNPDHPSSRGGTDLFDQAAILALYDPDRAQSVQYMGSPRSWEAFVAALERLDLDYRIIAGTHSPRTAGPEDVKRALAAKPAEQGEPSFAGRIGT